MNERGYMARGNRFQYRNTRDSIRNDTEIEQGYCMTIQ